MGYYGQLNTPISKPNYGGSTTDSLVIKVDNDQMIISGEVIWKDILGNEADKAYPGNLGNQNYENILKLSVALNQEINRALNVEKILTQQVEKGVITAQESANEALQAVTKETERATSSEDILRRTILNEVNKLIDNEAELLSKINTETETRTNEDKLIKDQLNYILNNISSGTNGIESLLQIEAERAQEAEKLLERKIEEETRRALNSEAILKEEFTEAINLTKSTILETKSSLVKNIENTENEINELKIKLSQEIENFENKDQEHESEIVNVKERTCDLERALPNSVALLKEADEDIRNYIDTEFKNDLRNYDSLIEAQLLNESLRAQNAESILQSNINSLTDTFTSTFTGPYVESKPTEPGKIQAYVAIGGYDFQIEVDSEAIPNTIARRGQNGHITLPSVSNRGDLKNFKDNDAIPKSYVHIVEDNLRQYIDSTLADANDIDFIEGGTTSTIHS